jgi:hypothetical protein
MQRKAVIVVALLYLLKRTYRYVKECIKHEQLIARIRNMAVYSVAEMKELLTKSPPGHKVYCFVRGTNMDDAQVSSHQRTLSIVC